MDIIDYLPQKMKAEAEAYMPCGLEEIRVRAGSRCSICLREDVEPECISHIAILRR